MYFKEHTAKVTISLQMNKDCCKKSCENVTFSPPPTVVLDELHTRVSAYEPYSPFTENEKTNSLMAIELMRSMEVPHVKGISFERGVTIVLPFGGIILRIALDAVLIWVDENGIKHVGAIKAKIKKGTFLLTKGMKDFHAL